MLPRERLDVIASLRSGRLAPLRATLQRDPARARSARALVEAGRLGSKEALALLVRHGGDLNAAWRGYRPIHALIQEQPHADGATPPPAGRACLKWMLAHGADPEQLGAFPPARAILIAAFVGEPAYIELLRAAGAKIDGFVAAALGDLRGVERRLKSDPAFAQARDNGGLTALQCCAASRMGVNSANVRRALLGIATLLLHRGADPNAKTKGWSHELDVIYFAANSGQRELFELLLTRGADATAALPSALWQKHTDLAEIALQHGARLDHAVDGGKPLLNQMIRWGQIRQALWLLERAASPNLPDESGWTAVHQAASRGNERMLKAVLAAGGDPSRKDHRGNTPRDIARLIPRPKMVALLSPAR
jgi:ankyrin repeat protein